MNPPRGVTIVGWLAMIGGVLQLLGSLGLVGISALNILVGSTGALQFEVLGRMGFGVWTGVVLVVLGLLGIAVGFELLQMRRWAWMTAIVLYSLNAVAAIALLFTSGLSITMTFVIVLSIVIAAYLLTPDVRGAFATEHTGGVSAGTPHPAS